MRVREGLDKDGIFAMVEVETTVSIELIDDIELDILRVSFPFFLGGFAVGSNSTKGLSSVSTVICLFESLCDCEVLP